MVEVVRYYMRDYGAGNVIVHGTLAYNSNIYSPIKIFIGVGICV